MVVSMVRSIGARKHRIVTRAANCLHERFRTSASWIEHYAGAMRHEVNARRLDSRGGAQSFFHVMLAGCAGHAQHRQCHRFCGGLRHLLPRLGRIDFARLVKMSAVACLFYRGKGSVDG